MVQKVEQLQVSNHITFAGEMLMRTSYCQFIQAYNTYISYLKVGQNPILVHCSAGVGRTGTFLAVYKLWLDYLNPDVKKLSILPIVVALRRQRCKMVQKKEQYVYIAKCLR